MSYEQILIIRILHQVDGINPEDKMRAANWILNGCNELQLSKIVRLAKDYNLKRSPESRESFIRIILNPEYILREGAD